MGITFETFGNASVQFCENGRPVLTTDPWLVGTCYFGSWALDHALTEAQIERVRRSAYLWISHGHPDHLHPDSIALLPKDRQILLPDHYNREIHDFFAGQGFPVTILRYREWVRLSNAIEVMCLDNENQDAILVVRAGDALVVNMNDSPLCGEGAFLKDLLRRHPNEKKYVLALCAIDADMLNLVDAEGHRVIDPAAALKPGQIMHVARRVADLGFRYFCCSSSQHIYARADSIWANDYRITWADMQTHWSRPQVKLIEPFATVDVETGAVTANHPSHAPDLSQISPATGDDDWDARLTADEWQRVEAFIRRFETIRDAVDFVQFTVGGESRRVQFGAARAGLRGIEFIVPKQSLLQTVEYGYFDDLLIGNFMKTRLYGTTLYPDFTPRIAKLGGNAKVFTRAQLRRFQWRYLRRNPRAFVVWRAEQAWDHEWLPWLRTSAERLGCKAALKRVYRRLQGDRVPQLGKA
jgi:hypothetical protein